MNWNNLLSASLDIGEQMQVSGAEIYRVEDCIQRICRAYGATDVDVFTITSSIVLTIQDPSGNRWTQTRRIEKAENNLELVDQLNKLSREMCQKRLSYESYLERFQDIMAKPRYPQWVEYLTYALIAGAFTLFVGSSLQDALVSMLVGAALKGTVYTNRKLQFNRVFSSIIASFVVSVLAFLAQWTGIAENADLITIGNIMLLIPGAALTNSLRDMISGDTMSGILRFMEACIVALAIASGYILAGFVLGGIMV